jgi:hypothetical protein
LPSASVGYAVGQFLAACIAGKTDHFTRRSVMKKSAVIVMATLVMVTIGVSLGAMFITEHAGLVSGALQELKFEVQPGNPKLIGAPPQLKVTKATIEYLLKLQNGGKIVEVQNDGSLKIK